MTIDHKITACHIPLRIADLAEEENVDPFTETQSQCQIAVPLTLALST